MAPTTNDDLSVQFGKRADNDCYYDYYGRCHSGWYYYGRWVLAAILVAGCISLFFLYAWINNRRRRKQGVQPMYGFGWVAPHGHHHAPQQNNQQAYNNGGQNFASAPPAYGAQSYPMQNQPTGQTFNPADGYYAQHEGVSPPKNVYAGAAATNYNGVDSVAPPPGPPPGKTGH